MASQRRQPRLPCVYLLASRPGGALYIGVTSDLVQRVWQHKAHAVRGHADCYNTTMLVWYEPHETMESAITREKAIKRWKHAWKARLIAEQNPEWRDLYEDICG